MKPPCQFQQALNDDNITDNLFVEILKLLVHGIEAGPEEFCESCGLSAAMVQSQVTVPRRLMELRQIVLILYESTPGACLGQRVRGTVVGEGRGWGIGQFCQGVVLSGVIVVGGDVATICWGELVLAVGVLLEQVSSVLGPSILEPYLQTTTTQCQLDHCDIQSKNQRCHMKPNNSSLAC